MLHELCIANLAVIEKAEISFGPGLNVLTGETGAGKSILISALGLLVGERAGKTPEHGKKAFVEGVFDLSKATGARAFLDEHGIELEEESTLIVSREISADKRNRIRLNGRLVTANTLRELGVMLLDLHGQHDHQLLLRSESHLEFLDQFGPARHAELRQSTRESWELFRAAQNQLEKITKNEQQHAQRLDMLQFQAEEIDSIAPEPDEENKLGEERARLLNAEKLRSATTLCHEALQGGDEGPGALTLARQALQAAREIEATDSTVSSWVGELESAIYQLEDAAQEARDYVDVLEADPLRLEEIESRLFQLTRLRKKYGDTLIYRAEIEEELARLDMSETETEELQTQASQLHAKYLAQAEKLSRSRRALAQDFSQKVEAQLHDLAMERARFEISFKKESVEGATGTDRIEFLLSANPGTSPQELTRIASGGEISRVMLALRTVQAQAEDAGPRTKNPKDRVPASGKIPIIVFDEIDTGIGGVTAEAVGEKMQELARSFQVFCVTHLPQIAKRADYHLRVLKSSDEASTSVEIRMLQSDERVRELARMMGRSSETTLQHAQEMLEESESTSETSKTKKTRSSKRSASKVAS